MTKNWKLEMKNLIRNFNSSFVAFLSFFCNSKFWKAAWLSPTHASFLQLSEKWSFIKIGYSSFVNHLKYHRRKSSWKYHLSCLIPCSSIACLHLLHREQPYTTYREGKRSFRNDLEKIERDRCTITGRRRSMMWKNLYFFYHTQIIQ
jgi:hypothetical protein